MAAKKSSSAMEFIVESLKSNRDAKYADIQAAAAKKKLKIYPIMFGRAQTLVGIVKAAPRGQGKAARAKAKAAGVAPVAAMPKRGPGRPPKQKSTTFDSLEGIVNAVKSSEQAKNRYRAALERIQAILADALS
ncbi:MAG: hypothetical protein K8J09_21885 [Planctomycetes bacterium]|nr:hypothetical protein [Planctomycetota bacterium]